MLIITRSRYGPDYDLEHNRLRLRLFSAITVPSLRAQTCREFSWVLMTHPHDPLLDERMAAARLSGVPVEQGRAWPRGGLQVRLDDDDAISDTFTERLLAAANRKPWIDWWTFPEGWLCNTSAATCSPMIHYANQFIARRCAEDKSVYDIKHGEITRQPRQSEVDREPSWIWMRHKLARSRFSNITTTPIGRVPGFTLDEQEIRDALRAVQ